MTLSPHLIGRRDLEEAAELKGRLVSFALTPPFQRLLRQEVKRHPSADPEEQVIAAVEVLLHEHRYDDGSTILDRFAARAGDLTPWQASLLASWTDSIAAIFEVVTRDGACLHLLNLYDDLEHVTFTNAGADSLGHVEAGWFIRSRIVPLGDAWMLSGLQRLFAPEDRAWVAEVVARTMLDDPERVLRNPEKRRVAAENGRLLHESFLECFGTDRLRVAGHEVTATYRRFLSFHTKRIGHDEARIADVEELVDEAEYADVFGSVAVVGIQHRADSGVWMFADYDVVEAAFADPTLAQQKRYRDVVHGYLTDDSIPRWVFEELGREHPQTRDRALANVLGRPAFSWARDGAALLDKHKSDTRAGLQPGIVPAPNIVAEHAASFAHHA